MNLRHPFPLRRTLPLLAFLLLTLISASAMAESYPWEEKEPHPWHVGVAPGYAFLYSRGDSKVHNGFYSDFRLGYEIVPHWRIDLNAGIGLYDGDKSPDEGIFSQTSILANARYTFLEEVYEPYVGFGLGWVRTELDRETNTIFVTHSMVIEAGGGIVFRLIPNLYLGVETSLAPILFGRSSINGSFTYKGLILLDWRP